MSTLTASPRFGACTDTGTWRELNEDAVLAITPVFAVADGMGGHAAGEVASALAIDALTALAGREDLRPADIRAAIDQANAAIVAREERDVVTAGMGTTLSGVCLGQLCDSPHWFVFNVGDSRVYHYARGELRQLTVDHSEVAELVAAGRITREEAREHPLRNVVTRSLGTVPPPVADILVLPAVPGERFLVCSDGLPLEVDDDLIAASMAGEQPAQAVADALVRMAVEAGGRDNVSVVVVELFDVEDDEELRSATAPRRSLGRAN